MKTIAKLGLIVTLAGLLFMSSCAGSYYVSDEPVEPVYVRPAAPYDGAIWIDGDWTWSGGRYVHSHGHWDRPRPGHTWTRGHWDHSQHGYRWHRGHWK